MSERDYLWENDPHGIPKDSSHHALVELGFYEWLKKRGVQPGDAQSGLRPEERQAYSDWFKKQAA